MRAIWTTSILLLATACGGADARDPAPTTSELAGEQDVDAPAPTDPGAGVGGESSGPPSCFAAPCDPTPPPKLHDCDLRKITCQTFAPVVCADGKVPTVVDSCYGECVSKDQCAPNADEPVACLAFIEASDGVCSREDDDPCRSQDPDCKS